MKNKKQEHFKKCFGANVDRTNCCHFEDPQHTPTPWGRAGAALIGNEAREIIGQCQNTEGGISADVNAAFIVQSVNRAPLFEEMVGRLKEVFQMIAEGILVRDISKDSEPEWHMKLKMLHDIIAKAEGHS